jgi:ubiquitin-protein ligase
MASSKLNKQLWTDINKLRLLKDAKTQPKFILDQSPFDDGEQETAAAAAPKEYVIIGRILPDSEIYKEGAYQIEMKLTATFPFDPPEVRFITKIYHPNVAEDGQFCHELLKKTAKWTNKTPLTEVIRAVVDHIDKPDIDYSLSLQLGREYMENRPEFNRKALDFVTKYALPRV